MFQKTVEYESKWWLNPTYASAPSPYVIAACVKHVAELVHVFYTAQLA